MLSDLMQLEFSRRIFEKFSNIKFNESPSSWNGFVPCGQREGQTDMTKRIVAFRNLANTSKNVENSFRVP